MQEIKKEFSRPEVQEICPLGNKQCFDEETGMRCKWFKELYVDNGKDPIQKCVIEWLPQLVIENTFVIRNLYLMLSGRQEENNVSK